MQNNTNDQMNKTKEIPDVSSVKAENDAVNNQQSLFDESEAFSEAMVVEKDTLEINSKESAQEGEISVKELQGTAKDYYDATHSDSIEDKIGELRRLANEGFEETSSFTDLEEILSDSPKNKKKDKKNKKKKKRGYVSDDDIELLMGKAPEPENDMEDDDVVKVFGSSDEFEEEEDNLLDVNALAENAVVADDGSVEYTNPLGTDEEETEEDKLIKALGGTGKHFKSFESVFGDDDEPEEEYTDRSQECDILAKLRKNAIVSVVSVFLTLVVTALCIYFEIAAGTKMAHPEFLEPGKYGVTYAMCMLQLMFLGVIFNFDGVKRAFRGLRPKKPSAEGFCAVVLTVCTLHSVLSCVAAHDSSSLVSLCSAGCVALLMLSVNSFVKAYTSLTAFCIAASKHPKFSSGDLGKDSLEGAAFEKYLENDTTIFTVEKNDFVKNFFKKTLTSPAASKGTFKMCVAVVAIAIVCGVVCGVFGGAYLGICAFTTICLAALPVNALISTALPFLFASMKAKKTQTAYIGEAACDAYENTGVVSFDDTEVFPAKSVKVSSIRTYGENRIDKVILYMAKIFDKIPGPLSYVFSNSVQSIDDYTLGAQIVEHFSEGISARIDGKEVFVGTADFLKLYDIETPLDNIDESFTMSLGSIMYMSVDGALAAKFYIKYAMNRNFEPLLRSFYDAGICVGIKTLDPCITNELVCGNLKGSNYPVSVIKTHSRNTDPGAVGEETDGTIISLSGVHNFLKGFIRLDNLRNVYRSNTLVSVFSMVIGIALAAFFNISGIASIGVLFVVIFQLIWCIPTVIFSLISR